jgi:hypothetical protein
MKLIFPLVLFTLSNLTNTQTTNITTFQAIPCGLNKPTIDNDCYGFTTESNSCCYYSYGSTHSCILLNTRFKGNLNYGALYVSCDKSFINIHLVAILLFFIILF